MNFQLVLQLSRKLIPDFDSLIELEEEIERLLGDAADVDGHDIGSGEANIFILTSEPEHCFKQLTSLLEGKGVLSIGFRAAFRSVSDDVYTVLWPEGSGEFDIV